MIFLSDLLGFFFHARIESTPTAATADNSIFNIDFKKVRNNLSACKRSQTLYSIHNGSNNSTNNNNNNNNDIYYNQ